MVSNANGVFNSGDRQTSPKLALLVGRVPRVQVRSVPFAQTVTSLKWCFSFGHKATFMLIVASKYPKLACPKLLSEFGGLI